MQIRYYISKDEKQMGPYTTNEVLSKVRSGEILLTDYYYDENDSDWRMLMEHQQWSKFSEIEKIQSTDKKAEELQPVSDSSNDSGLDIDPTQISHMEWYALKGNNRFGPFSYYELIGMLQEKHLFEFDYVWYPGMQSWHRVAEFKCFQPDKIRALHDKNAPLISELFFRRRHKRAHLGGSIVAHNNKYLWKGESIEVSPGGAGVVIHNAQLMPGDAIYLHFKPADGIPPFNAVCEVVSKEYVPNIVDPNTAIKYGVKFTSISQEAQTYLKKFTSSKVAA